MLVNSALLDSMPSSCVVAIQEFIVYRHRFKQTPFDNGQSHKRYKD